jgi:hypothetical protein
MRDDDINAMLKSLPLLDLDGQRTGHLRRAAHETLIHSCRRTPPWKRRTFAIYARIIEPAAVAGFILIYLIWACVRSASLWSA